MPTVSHALPSEPDLELLSAYVDGELTGRERAEVEQRLTHDPELRAALADLRQTVALVRSLPPLKAPRNFTLNPALYGRKKAWWRVETRLEWVGMLGTAASIVLMVLGVLISQNRQQAQQKATSETGASEAVAITNAQPTTLATLLTSAPTEIAYAGENIQMTGEFQATYFGGTETAVAAAPMIAAAAAPPVGTASPVGQAGPMDESVGGAAPLAAEAPSGFDGSAADIASTGSEEYSPDTSVAPGLYEGEAALGAAAMPAPETATLKQTEEVPAPGEPPAAFRQTAPSPTVEALNDVSVTAPPTLTTQSWRAADEHVSEKKETTRSRWWLLGLGGITLVGSILILLAGRRKARS